MPLVEIEMLKLAAGPAGVREAGHRYQVDAAEAEALIAAGAAAKLTAPAPSNTPESATDEGGETAELTRPRGRRQP